MDLCLITWSAPNGHWLCHQQRPKVLQIKTYGWNVSLNTMTVIVWPQCLNFDWKLKCNFFRKATVVNYGEITAVLAAPIYAGYLEGVAIEAAVWRVSDPSFSLQACDQPHEEEEFQIWKSLLRYRVQCRHQQLHARQLPWEVREPLAVLLLWCRFDNKEEKTRSELRK